MPTDQPAGATPTDRRKEIFLAVVEAQDGGMGVVASRTAVAETFGVTADEVKEIEKEGLNKQWPPLDR